METDVINPEAKLILTVTELEEYARQYHEFMIDQFEEVESPNYTKYIIRKDGKLFIGSVREAHDFWRILQLEEKVVELETELLEAKNNPNYTRPTKAKPEPPKNICIQTGQPCGFPCYHECPVYKPQLAGERKTAFEILKERHLLIEDDKTCECHTRLVIEAMEEYASQRKTVWPDIEVYNLISEERCVSKRDSSLLRNFYEMIKKEVDGKNG